MSPTEIPGSASLETREWPGNVLLDGIPHSVYHSDPWGPSLSQSVAGELCKCPLLGWAAHPRLGGQQDKPTAEMETGALLHALVLGSGPQFASLDYPDYRTNAAKIARDEAIFYGLTPVLAHKYQAALEISTAIVRALSEREGINVGEYAAEQTALWTDPAEGVRCHGRFDLWRHGEIVDPKFTTSSPEAWIAGMTRMGYDIQSQAYVEAAETIFPELAGRVEFTYVLINPNPPYTTCRVDIGGTMKSLGQDRWHRAKLLWKEGLATGNWPSYRRVLAEARTYQLQNELEQAIGLMEDSDGQA